MIKHILFDCDGVLVDTEIMAAEVMVEALLQKGVDISVKYYLQQHAGLTFSSVLDKHVGNSLKGVEKRAFINKLENKIVEHVEPIQGVAELLKSISLPKSIVSNSEIWQVKQEIERTNIDQYFTGQIFSSELVVNPKPAPDVYNLAKKKLGLAANELLVVEDSLTGAQAALAADLRVVGFIGASHILPGHGAKMLELGVAHVAENMQNLGEVIKLLCSGV